MYWRDKSRKHLDQLGIWTQDLLITSQMLYQLSHWIQVKEDYCIDNVYYLDAGKFSCVSFLKLFHNRSP